MPNVPFLMLFPYLRMEGTIKVGPWSLQRIDPGVLASKTDDQSVWIRALLGRLRDPDGRPLDTATLVARRIGHPEPEDPDDRSYERYALEAAVSFAVADANARFGNEIDWSRGPIATAEVANFFMAQMQLETKGAFARKRGGAIYQKLIGGGTIFDEFVLQPAPEGLLDMPEIKLDPELLNAVYEVDLSAWADDPDAIHDQVSAALHWHSRAWENSPLHTMPDVLVQLKTAIEALSGEHRTREGVPKLEAMYRAVDGTLGERDFLWDGGAPNFPHTYRGQTTQVSAFAAWYWNLANLRNDIVHSTKRPEMQYNESGSPFAGNVFQIAERVTRELIKIRLAQLGYPLAAITPTNRRILAVAKEHGIADQLTLIPRLP